MKYISRAALERVLELEAGSIEKWQKEGYPEEAMALFRILKLFPWMLTVAEYNYDKEVSDKLMRFDALTKIFGRLYEYNGFLTEA